MISTRLRHALEQYGDRTAVEAAGGQWQLSGAQLLGRAGSLLETLAPYADRPLVAYLHKSPLYYVFTACAFLHGVSYCPLDIEVPLERVLKIAGQLAGALILCDDHEIFARLRDRTEHCLELALADPGPAVGGASRRSDASYYIATSGSTGVPKLVQVAHDRTAAFVDWAIPFYRIDREVRWAQFSSIGFDLSLVDFLSVLCGGGTLVSLSARMDRVRPAKTVARARITHWHSVPSMIPYFLREHDAAPPCRVFTFCGEPLMKADVELLAACYPGARIINTYGPTEGTLFCSFFEYQRGDPSLTESSLPIGQPIPSWNFVLVPDDSALRLVIVSDNVADGYAGLRVPQFGTVDVLGTPMRAFDTGDYFRVVGSHLYFSHRRDGMVKIHGNRIDLGDVEAAGKKLGLVNPVALVVGDGIAVVAEGDPAATADIMAGLARYLPRSSLPVAIHFVASHPRTVNGKLDRRAIRDALGAP